MNTTLLSASGNAMSLIGDTIKLPCWYGFGQSLSTCQIQISNFIGTLIVEGSVEINPTTQPDWVPIITQTYSVATTQTTGTSFQGSWNFIRARLDRSTLLNPAPATISAAYGTVDLVALSSSSNIVPTSGGGSGSTPMGVLSEGTGTSIFDSVKGNNYVFKSLTGQNGLIITQDTDSQTIILSAPSPTYTGIDLQSNANDVGTVETVNFTGAATVTKVGSVATVAISSGDPSDYVILKYSGGASGDLSSVDSIQSSSVNVTATIVDGPNCIVEFVFTGRSNPPSSIAIMGQNYSTNTFNYQNINPNISTRSMTFSGSADSPNIFGGFQSLTIQLRMSDTSSSAPFGSRAIAAIYFKF